MRVATSHKQQEVLVRVIIQITLKKGYISISDKTELQVMEIDSLKHRSNIFVANWTERTVQSFILKIIQITLKIT